MYTSYQLHGYIEDGKCYDNQYIFYEQSNEKYQKLKKQNQEKFEKYKFKVTKVTKTLEDLYSKIRKYRDSKNYISRMKEILKKGYVLNTQKVGGSKRARRHKKNARYRFLTEHEIENYKEKIILEERNKIAYKQAIKPKKAIEDVFFTLGMTVEKMKTESVKMNYLVRKYGDTIFLFSIFEEVLQKFDKEIYNEVLVDYKEVLKIDKEERVQKKKVVKNKTRFYIDENGVEHTIKEDVEQIIRAL
tara:strand:+ start:190 stop:924 length:735 start_codon:yes stop_codon:yes gene_type:complete